MTGNPADRPTTEPRHMRQSTNGCVTCPKRWSDHTLAEAAQGAAPLPQPEWEADDELAGLPTGAAPRAEGLPESGWFDPVNGDGYAPDQPKPTPTTEAYRRGFSDGEEWATRLLVAPRAEGLDVDWNRMAEAWGTVMDGRRIGQGINAPRIGARTTTDEDWESIASEYARLSRPSDGRVPEDLERDIEVKACTCPCDPAAYTQIFSRRVPESEER